MLGKTMQKIVLLVIVINLAAPYICSAAYSTAPKSKKTGKTASPEGELKVYQNLEELTARIKNLDKKPYQKLIKDGFYQPEITIFKDLETGNEVWSLTRELCTDLANIERRCAWSQNGQYISFIGNMAFYNYLEKKLITSRWAGYNYIANSDGSGRRKLWGNNNGKLKMLSDKFNNWDQKKPNVLYYPEKERLWRVTLGEKEQENKAEAIYKFPNAENKIIQEISDENFMLLEESGQNPNCYVINLNKDPWGKNFCLSYPLKGAVHPGSFRFKRSQRVVTGGYESRSQGAIWLKFDENGITAAKPEPEKYQASMAHLWYGQPDDRVGFSGSYKGKSGLFVQKPGQEPVHIATVSDGHPSWCGHDPDWFFYAVGDDATADKQYDRRLLACDAEGKTVKIICTPFDRRRGDEKVYGYDAIPRPNQSPDATKSWFHSSMLNPDNSYTGSYIAVFRKPYPPEKPEVTGSKDSAVLTWTPNKLSFEVKGYHIYISEDGGKTFKEISKEIVSENKFDLTGLESGKSYKVGVTAEEWSRLESDKTSEMPEFKVDGDNLKLLSLSGGVSGFDKEAPKKVEEFKLRYPEGWNTLSWKANMDKDLRYYNIYFSAKGKPELTQERLIVSPPAGETEYIDWTAPKNKPGTYAIIAVDRQDNRSEPSFVEVR